MHHWGYFPPFGFLLFLIIIGFFITNIIIWRRRRNWLCPNTAYQNTAQRILQKRLASGEIDIQEYKALRDVLDSNLIDQREK